MRSPRLSYFGNGSSTTVFRNRGETRYQATGAKTTVRITAIHKYRLGSLPKPSCSHLKPQPRRCCNELQFTAGGHNAQTTMMICANACALLPQVT